MPVMVVDPCIVWCLHDAIFIIDVAVGTTASSSTRELPAAVSSNMIAQRGSKATGDPCESHGGMKWCIALPIALHHHCVDVVQMWDEANYTYLCR